MKERFRVVVDFELELEGFLVPIIAKRVTEKISEWYGTGDFNKIEVTKLSSS